MNHERPGRFTGHHRRGTASMRLAFTALASVGVLWIGAPTAVRAQASTESSLAQDSQSSRSTTDNTRTRLLALAFLAFVASSFADGRSRSADGGASPYSLRRSSRRDDDRSSNGKLAQPSSLASGQPGARDDVQIATTTPSAADSAASAGSSNSKTPKQRRRAAPAARKGSRTPAARRRQPKP